MIIETVDLTKLYNGRPGCKDICLSVSEGQVFGFLGPNGAGKSTVIKTLLGLLKPTSGQAMVLGKPLGDCSARKKIGFLPEAFRFQEWLSGQELLEFHSSMYKINPNLVRQRIAEVFEITGLKGREKDRIQTYSKGMQQRLGLASAMLPKPQLLFLDEPTSALDPLGRKEVRDIIHRLKEEGTTIFLNSHLLSEVEMTCDEVAFIKKGRVADSGRLEQFLSGDREVTIRYEGPPEILEALSKVTKELTMVESRVRARVASEEDIPLLAAAVTENGGRLYELTSQAHSLEEVFITLMEDNN
ncbi:MAG: ABC transporter ATP-binding protein [Chitinophagales bacterium]